MLQAAGWPGSACSPDGFLPLLRIRGHIGLHLLSRPLYLHFNDLWRTETERLRLRSQWVFGGRPHVKCCNILFTPPHPGGDKSLFKVQSVNSNILACKTNSDNDG